MTKQKNPLLYPFDTLYETVPFEQIEPSFFEPALKQKINYAKKNLRKITANKASATVQNTLVPLEILYDEVSRIGQILFNLNSAATSDEIQQVTQKVSPILTRFMSGIMLNRKLFKRITNLYNERHQLKLNAEENRLLEITFSNMQRNGAALNPLKKLKLIRIQMKLSKLTLLFNDHVLAETNNFELHITNKNELKGLPNDILENASLKASQKNKPGWIFTLQYPDYVPFMKFAQNRALREKMYRAYTSRGNQHNANDNNKLIKKIINLRIQQAQLLSYKNFADYVLEERMASNTDVVRNFIDNLLSASLPFARHELEQLQIFASKKGAENPLMPWDFSYYSEKMKDEHYGFDESMLKPFFQLEKVVEATFNLAQTLYGISFSETTDLQIYDNDIKTYKIIDADNNFLAVLYLDFFPRENKQGGAWMTEFRAQSNINSVMKRPHISICCNFTKPTSTQPSLLTFNEATTFLHEFGHALHGIFANTVFPSLSGTNVFRDFVELPSQIMENWLCEPEWLKSFAVHYQTGEPIPDELINKLIAARNFQAGYQSVRQLSFAMLDMGWHTLGQTFKGNVVDFEKSLVEATRLLPNVEGSCTSTSFGHIFGGGYAAGYYGYKWAEVLDADAFSVFKKDGIFNRELGTKFRKELLEKGGTVDPNALYVQFRGKEASIDALLDRSGLKSA